MTLVSPLRNACSTPASILSPSCAHRLAPIGIALFALVWLALASWLGGCDGASRTASASEPAVAHGGRSLAAAVAPWRVDRAEARALVASGAVLLDVRTADEFRDGHLAGALNVPLSDLDARFSELPSDRPLVVYCASGRRSARAVSWLRSRGMDARDLGPMRAWD